MTGMWIEKNTSHIKSRLRLKIDIADGNESRDFIRSFEAQRRIQKRLQTSSFANKRLAQLAEQREHPIEAAFIERTTVLDKVSIPHGFEGSLRCERNGT
nr:hypothetical protein CFP56_11093 [Quercus suber]